MHIAREPRHKVVIRATMRAGGPRIDVCVRDVSSRGMMIQMRDPPARGTYVDVDCAGHQVVGIVVWRRDHRFGVQSCERINVSALRRGLPESALAPSRAPFRPSALPARRAGTARALAGRMEFAVIAMLAAMLVAGLGVTVFETLSRPFAAVSDVLGP